MNPIRTAGLVCSSNGLAPSDRKQVESLTDYLSSLGITVLLGPHLYTGDSVFSGTARQRAQQINDFFADDRVDAIFDLSGGDLANEVLPYLDYETIRRSRAAFWGYSDLTTILNAIEAKTGKSGVLYSIKNLVRENAEQQRALFSRCQQGLNSPLFSPFWQALRGGSAKGRVAGGNIRCFLKLAGTPFFPDLNGRLLLLESLGGTVPQMTTYLAQLEQLGAFQQVRGILLGTFSRMEQEGCRPTMEDLVLERIPKELPVFKTQMVGHGPDSRAVMIGETLELFAEG